MNESTKKIVKTIFFAIVISIIYSILSWCIDMLHSPLYHDKFIYYLEERIIFILIGLLPALFTMKYFSIIFFTGSLLGQFVNFMICQTPQQQMYPSMTGAAYEIMITLSAIIIGIIVQIVVFVIKYKTHKSSLK